MARLAVDEAAWSNAWRRRSTAEKSLLALGLLAVAVTAVDPLVPLGVMGVAVAAALAGARVRPRTFLLAVAAPAGFVALGAVVIAVSFSTTTPEDALFSLGPVHATPDSVDRAVLATARSAGAMAALMLLATTTPINDLLTGLRTLRVPEVVVDVAGLIYRMLFSLLEAAFAIRAAQAARLGYATGGAARRSLGSLISAVLLRAWTRAVRLEEGLVGRGYGTSLRTVAVARPVSWPFVATAAVVVAALALWSAGVVA